MIVMAYTPISRIPWYGKANAVIHLLNLSHGTQPANPQRHYYLHEICAIPALAEAQRNLERDMRPL